MKATYVYAAGDVRTVEVPDPAITDPGDAIIRIVRAAVCGSDLSDHASMQPSDADQAMLWIVGAIWDLSYTDQSKIVGLIDTG